MKFNPYSEIPSLQGNYMTQKMTPWESQYLRHDDPTIRKTVYFKDMRAATKDWMFEIKDFRPLFRQAELDRRTEALRAYALYCAGIRTWT